MRLIPVSLDPIKKRQQQQKKKTNKKKQLLIYSRFSEGLVCEITLRQIDPIVTLCIVFYRVLCRVASSNPVGLLDLEFYRPL